MKSRILAALLALSAAAACTAASDSYPSLSPRAIEHREEEPKSAAPPPGVIGADTGARIAALLGDARRGAKDFDAAWPGVARAVSAAKGGAVSGEAWIEAQQQLSALDAARTPTATAMTALDTLYIDLAEKAAADAGVGGVAEADAARAEVEALYNDQIARLGGLQDALSPP